MQSDLPRGSKSANAFMKPQPLMPGLTNWRHSSAASDDIVSWDVRYICARRPS